MPECACFQPNAAKVESNHSYQLSFVLKIGPHSRLQKGHSLKVRFFTLLNQEPSALVNQEPSALVNQEPFAHKKTDPWSRAGVD